MGLPDNDEDNFADSLGSVDISKIKLHRAIVGDTINFTLNGRVVTDIPDSSFSNIQIDFEINLDSFDIKLAPKLDLVFSNLINPTKGLVNISNNLKIIQFGSESPMFLNNISLKQNPTIDLESKSILYSYNLSILELSKLNPNFPKDFIFKEGDSIVFNSTFKIDYNIHSQSSNSYIHPRKHEFMFFEVHSKALLNNNPNYDIKTQFLCDCKKDTLEIYNTILDYEGTTNSIYPCHSIITKRYTFKYGIRPNTFPYEIRSPVLFKAIKMPKIVGLDIIDAELERYFSNGKVIYNQDGPKINFDSIIHINYPYSIGVFEGYYHYNLNFLDALEKGEFIETRFWFYYKLSECEFNLGQKSYNSTAVSYFVPKKIEFNLNRGSNFWEGHQT